MADGDKTFTEQEHLAILADRVATETAVAVAERDTVKQERDDLASKLDVAESAKVAAEQRAEKAEQDFEAYKSELTQLAEQSAKKDERIDSLKEVAAHLGDDFFKDEARVTRIVAMDDDSFAAYRDDLKSTAPAGTTAPSGAPRETAMSGAGSTAAAGAGAPSAARSVMLGRYPTTATQEG